MYRFALGTCKSPLKQKNVRQGTAGLKPAREKHANYGRVALLFVGGVMNVLWLGVLALLILLEKVTPWARITNLADVVFVAAGA